MDNFPDQFVVFSVTETECFLLWFKLTLQSWRKLLFFESLQVDTKCQSVKMCSFVHLEDQHMGILIF